MCKIKAEIADLPPYFTGDIRPPISEIVILCTGIAAAFLFGQVPEYCRKEH
jgi:hypothetical protein